MSDLLPIPPELLHLIEKRETPDRRQAPPATNVDDVNEESAELPCQQNRRRNPRRQDET